MKPSATQTRTVRATWRIRIRSTFSSTRPSYDLDDPVQTGQVALRCLQIHGGPTNERAASDHGCGRFVVAQPSRVHAGCCTREVTWCAIASGLCCSLPKAIQEQVRERIARLAELRRQASTADIDMTVSVQHGNPADVILAHANSGNTAPDVIVVGAPSRRGIERLRWTSVAQAIVHQADRPTLVVPGSPSTDRQIATPFRRVLCAIDFSPASMSALDEALRTSGMTGA